MSFIDLKSLWAFLYIFFFNIHFCIHAKNIYMVEIVSKNTFEITYPSYPETHQKIIWILLLTMWGLALKKLRAVVVRGDSWMSVYVMGVNIKSCYSFSKQNSVWLLSDPWLIGACRLLFRIQRVPNRVESNSPLKGLLQRREYVVYAGEEYSLIEIYVCVVVVSC